MKIYIAIFLLAINTFASTTIGKIVLKKGNVYVVRDNSTLKVNRNGFFVKQKDTIKTLKNARAQIIFNDDTIITIGSNTVFHILDYLYDNKKPRVNFSFSKGIFQSITGKIGKISHKNFILQTKTATIGIRGTIVLGKIGNDGDKIFCIKGLIEVKNKKFPGTVMVPAGKYTLVTRNKKPLEPKIYTHSKLNIGQQNIIPKNVTDTKNTNNQNKTLNKTVEDINSNIINNTSNFTTGGGGGSTSGGGGSTSGGDWSFWNPFGSFSP